MTFLVVVLVVLVLFALLSQSKKNTSAVEHLERRIEAALPPEQFSAAVTDAAKVPGTDGLIGAIRQYRAETGANLADAKRKIEQLRSRLGVT